MNVSVFRHFWDQQPVDSTLEAVVQTIRSDERTRMLTEGYRQQRLASLKNESMLFAVPCIFQGGKARKHLVGLTGLAMVDFDHVAAGVPAAGSAGTAGGEGAAGGAGTAGDAGAGGAAAVLADMRRKLVADPHTLLCHTTISGEGLRVLYRYEVDTGFDLQQQVQFYPKAFATGNAYYEQLVGAPADGQCKNVTRLSVVAHDEDVYFNPQAVPFTAEWVEQHWQSAHQAEKEQRREARELKRLQTCYEQTIRPEVEAEGAVYGPGSHNDYVMRVGYKLNQFGFSQQLAMQWAAQTFPDYDKASGVVASCYSTQTDEFASRAGQKRHCGRVSVLDTYASVEDIRQFLQSHLPLRHNVITGRVECQMDDGGGGEAQWQPLSDRVVNSLWVEMSRTCRVNVHDLYRVVESDFVPAFHPFRAYLDQLPPPDGRDYLGELASTVTVKGGPVAQQRFADYLRKWLVAMVASWVDEAVVNNVILVLIGEQGTYKTTWFNSLLPPELSAYFYTKTNANRMGRDDLLTLAQYGLVCCEELDTMRPAELNQLKAAVTMPSIDERAAYAHFHEHRKHIASFCGTGNNVQFLSDPTGNRRWLPFEVEHIRSPRDFPFCHQGIYAQAYALYRSGFQFWFSHDDIVSLSAHNRQFEAPHLEDELVQLYFRQPAGQESGVFMSIGRALQLVSDNVQQKLSPVQLGRAFVRLGFRRVKWGGQRGYIVVPRTSEEIQAVQRMMALQSETDDAT